ncbi:glycosyltransferase family 2 protein [Curtobacterium sp. MCPF17_046]|uniref:glycosyltransferase family 2 protein n=1 Tax=Curtobacterium sp. MCPF17_046 TaxID=2175663 RepID=UPI0011B82112|nr:glycosyl transferase [Curtobacterium sp. MCPF17_046]
MRTGNTLALNVIAYEMRTTMASIAVVIATAGRPDAARDIINTLEDSRIPDFFGFLSAPDDSDVPDMPIPEKWTVCTGVRGASSQRNKALDMIPETVSYVFFFDDDSVPRHDYISSMLDVLGSNPEAVAATGRVVLDGAAAGTEFTLEQCERALAESLRPSRSVTSRPPAVTDSLYGCNFCVRWAATRDLRFDEDLPLYSWLEDLDYAKRALSRGQLLRVDSAVTAHRGSSTGGRTSHRRFGYSQIANPLHLRKKRSLTIAQTVREMMRPSLKNLALALVPSARFASRRSRLSGNLLAAGHALVGRAHPSKMLNINDGDTRDVEVRS